MRFLVDTNVFLDSILKRDGYQDADLFFEYSLNNRNEICVTSMSMRDIRYTAHRFYHSEEKAKKVQMLVYEMCTKVIGISADDAIESLYSDMNDYEDSLLNESAKRHLIDVIITNNKKDFRKGDIPTFTPKEIMGFITNN